MSRHASITTVCIGCGCDYLHACDGGCAWIRQDPKARRGVCSECPDHVQRFDAGDRKLTVAARLEVDMREAFS